MELRPMKRPISSHLDHEKQAWPIKDLLHGQKETFFLQNQHRESLAGKMCFGSKPEHRIRFVLPAHGTSHMIKYQIRSYLTKIGQEVGKTTLL